MKCRGWASEKILYLSCPIALHHSRRKHTNITMLLYLKKRGWGIPQPRLLLTFNFIGSRHEQN